MPEDARLEVLIVRGRIDRAGRFTPGRCASTFQVRRWPDTEDGPYVIELLDREGRPIHRERASVVRDVTCDPRDPEHFRVTAYIGLRPDAATVQLRCDELVVWRREIPEAPSLDVRLDKGRPSRQEPVRVRVAFSRPGEGAYMQVIYRWNERRFRSVAISAPAEAIEIDLEDLPGGLACRFVVIYSNGVRSAVAATREFPLDRLGPSVTILQPRPRATVTTGEPLILQGHVIDPERGGGAALQNQLTWLVDEREAARGPLTHIDSLAPGRHAVTLRYAGEPRVESTVAITVRRAEVPVANEWAAWDEWSELPEPPSEPPASR
jgi:hypothetical protein